MFENKVIETRKGNKVRRWVLGTLDAERGQPTEISAITGQKGSVRAAAWNLTNSRGTSTERYLRNVLRRRVQVGSAGSGVRFHVPGAQVHVVGYEDPLAINLEAVVDGMGDRELALQMMVEDLCQTVARGVYAQTNDEETEIEKEEDTGDIEQIAF